MNKNNKYGFTLVELLAVIVILAIILVIAVPTIMNTIDNSREGALMSSAKLIAASAETKKMTNDTLEISETITCDMVADINSSDYESCTISFDDSGNAKVSIAGKGKFEGKYVCSATRSDAAVTTEACETSVVSTGVSMLSELLSQESELNNGLIQTTATYNETTYDAGIRYAGSNPNNYIYFNCKDKDSNNVAYGDENYDYASSCETWRIIGVFDTKTSTNGSSEKRIKIINTASTFTASWDSSDSTINSGFGVNEWSQSDLNSLLNGYYIGAEGSTCTYCSGSSQATCTNTCDTTETPLSSKNMKPLTSIALSQVENAVWDTYGVSDSLYPVTSDNASEAYLQEKGISTQYTGKECTADDSYCSDTVARTTDWTGLVGLMSVADIGYANGWLYDSDKYPWSISPRASSNHADYVWRAFSSYARIIITTTNYGVWPSLYLKANIRLTGLGTSASPYKIVI